MPSLPYPVARGRVAPAFGVPCLVAAVLVILGFFGAGWSHRSVAGDLPRIEFVGAAPQGKAKLLVDGRLYQLRPGDSFRSGMTLLSANSREAIVGIDGTTYLLPKGVREATALSDEVVLPRDSAGMFVTEGEINARVVTFVVDTGATWVAISAQTARRLALRYRKNKPVKIQTASRIETAYLTTLDSVRIGGIVRSGVAAVITTGKYPDVVLLGMSFLSGLSLTYAEDTMTIKP